MGSRTERSKNESQAQSSNRMYTARASKYDDSHHPEFASWVVEKMLKPQPGERILDLACGTGLATFPAAEAVGARGYILGVDVSDGMLEQANKKLKDIKQSVRDIGDIELVNHSISDLRSCPALQDKENTFDAIACVSALVLLQEPWFVLREWIKYLKPGGRLVIDVTHIKNLPLTTAMEMTYNKMGIPSPHFRLWAQSEDNFRRVLESAGLSVEEVVFQPNTGAAPKHHKVDEWEQNWEKLKDQTAAAQLFEPHLVEEARSTFQSMWAKLANDEGVIEEIDGAWVARAYKPTSPPPHKAAVIKGSCACGAFTWSSTQLPAAISSCYCLWCRKISGAPFVTFGDFDVASLTIQLEYWKDQSNEEAVRHLWLSPNARRSFCSRCMASMSMVYMAEPQTMAMSIGSVDEHSLEGGWKALERLRRQHIYTKDTPGWYSISDDGIKRRETMKNPSSLFTFK